MSDIASCRSLKSMALNLICGEVGFIGISPSHPEKTFNDFNAFFENIQGLVRQNDLSDPYCNFTYSMDGEVICRSFDVNFQKDLGYLVLIGRKNQITINMCAGVDTVAVGLCVDNIYSTIGEIMNQDDEYFEVVQELWKTLDRNHSRYEILVDTKIKALKRCLSLSSNRIDQLLSS
ncbi:hypothetical protein [Vibrio harveyi]|uniref:hypothetical protein n=1 Tax=Vibrio harveyi TaxID=669 RepID=UPI003CF8812B